MITEILPWPLYSLFHVEDEPSSPPTGIKNEVANLLRHYETPGVSPPHSRINPNLKRLERRPIRIWDVWKYGAIVAYKGEPFMFTLAQAHGYCLYFQVPSARTARIRSRRSDYFGQLRKSQEMRSLIRSGDPARNHGEYK